MGMEGDQHGCGPSGSGLGGENSLHVFSAVLGTQWAPTDLSYCMNGGIGAHRDA